MSTPERLPSQVVFSFSSKILSPCQRQVLERALFGTRALTRFVLQQYLRLLLPVVGTREMLLSVLDVFEEYLDVWVGLRCLPMLVDDLCLAHDRLRSAGIWIRPGSQLLNRLDQADLLGVHAKARLQLDRDALAEVSAHMSSCRPEPYYISSQLTASGSSRHAHHHMPATIPELKELSGIISEAQTAQLATTIWYRYHGSALSWADVVVNNTMTIVCAQPATAGGPQFDRFALFLTEIHERLPAGIADHMLRWVNEHAGMNRVNPLAGVDARAIQLLSTLVERNVLPIPNLLERYALPVLEFSLAELFERPMSLAMSHALLLDNLSQMLQAVFIPSHGHVKSTDPLAELSETDLHLAARRLVLYETASFDACLRFVTMLIAHEWALEAQSMSVYVEPLRAVRTAVSTSPDFKRAFIRIAPSAAAKVLRGPAAKHVVLRAKLLDFLTSAVEPIAGI